MQVNAKKNILKYANVILLAVMIVIAAVATDSFFSVRNLMNILRQISILGLLAMGMTFVILVGHMDLSAGAVMTFTGIIAISFQQFMPPMMAIVCALGVGLLAGLLNGAIVVATKANSGESLMLTLGTQMVFAALSLLYTGGFTLEGSESEFFNNIGAGMVGKVPVPVILFLACCAVLAVLQRTTRFGRSVQMVGYNAEAARLSGIKNGRIKILCYMMGGLMAALAAVVLSSRTLGASPTAGDGYEMDAITAIVLGGTSLAGGAGGIVQTLVGLLIVGVLGNMMNMAGFEAFDQMIVKGCVMILAVALDVLKRRQLAKA